MGSDRLTTTMVTEAFCITMDTKGVQKQTEMLMIDGRPPEMMYPNEGLNYSSRWLVNSSA